MTADLVNHDEPCRACRGRKGEWDRQDRGDRIVRVWEPCFFCRGTGCQTVRFDPAPCGIPRNHGEEIANARAGF